MRESFDLVKNLLEIVTQSASTVRTKAEVGFKEITDLNSHIAGAQWDVLLLQEKLKALFPEDIRIDRTFEAIDNVKNKIDSVEESFNKFDDRFRQNATTLSSLTRRLIYAVKQVDAKSSILLNEIEGI